MKSKHTEPLIRSIPITETGCWLFDGYWAKTGYGSVWLDGGPKLTHRAAWEEANGPIPIGLHVLHRCDVRACVNPAHLFLGTNDDNVADMVRKGRQQCAKGEQASRVKLTEAEVLAIRADPRLQREIAEDYGIHKTHVSAIKLRKTWGHLD